MKLIELFEIQFGVKLSEKGWHAVKQNNQPTKPPVRQNGDFVIRAEMEFDVVSFANF